VPTYLHVWNHIIGAGRLAEPYRGAPL